MLCSSLFQNVDVSSFQCYSMCFQVGFISGKQANDRLATRRADTNSLDFNFDVLWILLLGIGSFYALLINYVLIWLLPCVAAI